MIGEGGTISHRGAARNSACGIMCLRASVVVFIINPGVSVI